MDMIDAKYIDFFGKKMYLYGLGIAIAVVVYLLAVYLLGKKRGFTQEKVLVFGAIALPVSWFFARLFYVIINLGYYVNTISRPSAMLHFYRGGYSMIGAIIGLVLTALLYGKKQKTATGKWMDVAIAPIGLFLLIARFSEQFTLNIGRGKEVEGKLSFIPFVTIDDFAQSMGGGSLNLAVFRFEALIGLVLFLLAVALFFSKAFQKKGKDGDVALLILGIFGITQVLLESLRDDGHLLWGFIRVSQVLAMFFPVVVCGVFTRRGLKNKEQKGPWILGWGLVLVAIGIGIYEEFQIDVSPHLIKEYLIMGAGLVLLLGTLLWMWDKTTKKVKEIGNKQEELYGTEKN